MPISLMVTKYANVPSGYSGVIQNLPLNSFKSPRPSIYS